MTNRQGAARSPLKIIRDIVLIVGMVLLLLNSYKNAQPSVSGTVQCDIKEPIKCVPQFPAPPGFNGTAASFPPPNLTGFAPPGNLTGPPLPPNSTSPALPSNVNPPTPPASP